MAEPATTARAWSEDHAAAVIGQVVTHHRPAQVVLAEADALAGDVFVDAYGHRWRVHRSRLGYSLHGVGFDCHLPTLLMETVILVGLRPAPPGTSIEDPTDPDKEGQ